MHQADPVSLAVQLLLCLTLFGVAIAILVEGMKPRR